MKRLIIQRSFVVGCIVALAVAGALTYAGKAAPDEMPCPPTWGTVCPP